MRNLRWLVPLILVPVSFVGCAFGATLLQDGINSNDPFATGWLVLGTGIVWLMSLLLPLVFLIVFARAAYASWRGWRRSKGRFTKAELADVRRADEQMQGLRHASALRQNLLASISPPPVQPPWDLVPNAGEVFFLNVPAGYARFYGRDVTFAQQSTFAYGRPAFVAAALTVTAMSNASARKAARREAAEQWREHQPTEVTVSNQRIICQLGHRRLSFYFTGMSAIFPEPTAATLVCQFEDTEPLMLHGPHVPSIAVLTTMSTLGARAVANHPQLQPLDSEPALDRHGPELNSGGTRCSLNRSR